MTVKAKDGHPLILAVEFVTRRGMSERGMIYFTPGNEVEVLELLKCNKFWNGIQICKPTTNRKTMFTSLSANAVECEDNWNYKEVGMSEVVQELSNAKSIIPTVKTHQIGGVMKGFAKEGRTPEGLQVRYNGGSNTIYNGDFPMIVGGIDHRIKNHIVYCTVAYSMFYML